MTDKDISWVRFAILDRGVCVWSGDQDENARFLDGVSPDFFTYEAATHQRALDEAGDDKQAAMHAALALRLSYGLAIESLFAFLCAAVQAPHCVFGWVSNYTNRELEEMVRRITREERILASKAFSASPVSWKTIASTIFSPLQEREPEQFAEQAAHFSKAWHTFADDFLNEDRRREYNALKHGIRTQPGALNVTIGLPDESEPLLEFDNPFSHRFAFLEKKRKSHYDIRQTTVVLEPERCIAGLVIITLSMHNLLGWLRAALGCASEFRFKRFDDADQVFGALHKDRGGIVSLSLGFSTQVAEAEYVCEREILAVYDEEPDDGA